LEGLKPKFHLLRHVTTRHERTSTTCRAAPFLFQHGGQRRSSSASAFYVLIRFIIMYYVSSQMKLIRLFKRITAIIILYTLQTN